MTAPLFQADKLSFAVDGRTLLQPVSASLERGRVYGLIGSGKSMLLKLLVRQKNPSGGIRAGWLPCLYVRSSLTV